MQTLLTVVIVLAAAGYLAWAWAPRRKTATAEGAVNTCGTCNSCSGCSRG